MEYAYFIGCMIIASVWILIYLRREDLRKEMLFGSILGAPFGLSEFLFVPEYWSPPSLFNLIDRIGFGIESILFGFFVAGISAVIFEVIRRKKVIKIKSDHTKHFMPYAVLIFLYLFLEILLPLKSIYNLTISLLVTSAMIAFRRKDLFVQILASGAFFSVLYFLLFLVFNQIFPSYITEIYSLNNFLGISILGVPIEEIFFAFAIGACWSTFFEFINGYRTASIK